jgi:signal transduction histidine kinase
VSAAAALHHGRLRNRLLVLFLVVSSVMIALLAAVTWWFTDSTLAAQAQQRAQVVADLGAFISSDTIRRQVEGLTGYAIEIGDGTMTSAAPGTVVTSDGHGRTIIVDYHTDDYRRSATRVVWAAILGTALALLISMVLAWALARRIAAPLERLAEATRAIGAGAWQQPVPQVGSGEVAALAADLEATRTHLITLTERVRRDERLATLGGFTATIAHEVRNPLSAVRLTVQMLMREVSAAHADELTIVADEVERLDLIVDELLAFAGGIHVQLAPCDLRAVVERVIRLLRRQAEHAAVDLHVDGTGSCIADSARLAQVLFNLIGNAIQAQHGGGVVTVQINDDGFMVRDQGGGLPEAVITRLFQPFVTTRSDGTGLGLHIAKAIIDAHEADLTYQTRDGGACFMVSRLTSTALT